MLNTILIIDDEPAIRENLETYFEDRGYRVLLAEDGKCGIEACRTTPVGLVLLDLRLPDLDGLEVLREIKKILPGTGVIIITAYGDVETAVTAMQMRADNFILKPINLDSLESSVARILEAYRAREEVAFLKKKVSRLDGSEHLKTMRQPQEVYHAIGTLAESRSASVLILGETGTGKGVVARIIHEMSDRKDYPFVDINCAGLSAELLESELFGHERGAFTDAKDRKSGLLEIADRGSLFLDEIGDLSQSVQAKLLKVIEEKNFRRLGGVHNLKVDVRIIASTNADLEQAIEAGRFREDLLYRLNMMLIHLPPLRERRDDILPLSKMFMDEFGKQLHKEISGFSPQAEAILVYYHWPGNIRELRNVVERAVMVCDGDEILPRHLPEALRTSSISR